MNTSLQKPSLTYLFLVNLFSMVNHVISGTNCFTFLFSDQIQAKYSMPWRFSSCFCPRTLQKFSVSQSGITRHKVLLFYWFHKGTMAEDTSVTHCKWNWKLVWWKLCNTLTQLWKSAQVQTTDVGTSTKLVSICTSESQMVLSHVSNLLKLTSKLLGLKGSLSKTENFGKNFFLGYPFSSTEDTNLARRYESELIVYTQISTKNYHNDSFKHFKYLIENILLFTLTIVPKQIARKSNLIKTRHDISTSTNVSS